jgi:hypothetical protein
MNTQTMQNSEGCPRFNFCSINVCPADPEAELRLRLNDENCCPFCLNKKSKNQKGIKTLAPNSVLKVVPESNLKMLNRRNQNRWQDLH